MPPISTLFSTLAMSAGLALAAASASAQTHDHAQHNAKPAALQDNAGALAEGEVKMVDKNAGELTVQHGPLANLGMPGMTMAFKVQDPAMLDKVKAGAKIRLRVEYLNNTFTVTRLETVD